MNDTSETIQILPVRRALLAVADKSGLPALAKSLVDLGIELVSTGNTAATLREAGVIVTGVSDITGFPEMLEGRVKTLHPRIHGAILADKRKPHHMAELEEQGIEPFDLVVVNLYPFMKTVLAGATADEVVEQIDVGGPAMVRAAAKNFESVAVVVRPDEYEGVLDELDRHGGFTYATRLRLAREAFEHVAAYDAAIAAWFADLEGDEGAELDRDIPEVLSIVVERRSELRYGENPHQRAALYASQGAPGPLGGAEVLQGKAMSFNNWLDAEAARATAALFDLPAAVIVKHHNPCGVAQRPTAAEAYRQALESDRVSAFGGIAAFNVEVDEEAATALSQVFSEVVVAPSFSQAALNVLAGKANLRVVRTPLPEPGGLDVRPIDGGALVQDMDTIVETRGDMKIVTTTEPSAAQWEDLLFAWKVAARVKSNAIVLARDLATVAVGAGQMNRLTAVDVAVRRAGDRARGTCLASDAFFPFRDGVDRAVEAGVAAIIQPGGSVRDEEVVAAAEERGIAMVFTGRRHFRH
ncbi:MAG: bifunctional phosphoribosylaminoimidazolecarboxamide formyltransferase/IMP cyclohydrolase [Actinomycetota bacterium]